MKFNKDFTGRYIAAAPLALALERAFECHILSQQGFRAPVLDIGCGDGIFASILFQDTVDAGIDPNGAELKKAAASGRYKELICGSAQSIPKKDGAFQTVFSNSVLEHIPDLPAVLKEACRVLADDGRMYVTVPTDRYDHFTITNQTLSFLGLKGLAARFRGAFNRLWKHYHYYDRAGWERCFNACGLSVVQCRTYNPRTTCLLLDGLVPLSIVSFVAHRTLGRWFVFPPLRRLYAPLLAAVFVPVIARFLPVQEEGGLVFFELRKKRA